VAPWVGLFGGAVRPPLLLVVSAIAERGSKSFVADSNLKEVSKLHSKDEDFSICRWPYLTADQGAYRMQDGKPGVRSSGAKLLARLSVPCK
jgi:hypothetical protein